MVRLLVQELWPNVGPNSSTEGMPNSGNLVQINDQILRPVLENEFFHSEARLARQSQSLMNVTYFRIVHWYGLFNFFVANKFDPKFIYHQQQIVTNITT